MQPKHVGYNQSLAHDNHTRCVRRAAAAKAPLAGECCCFAACDPCTEDAAKGTVEPACSHPAPSARPVRARRPYPPPCLPAYLPATERGRWQLLLKVWLLLSCTHARTNRCCGWRAYMREHTQHLGFCTCLCTDCC